MNEQEFIASSWWNNRFDITSTDISNRDVIYSVSRDWWRLSRQLCYQQLIEIGELLGSTLNKCELWRMARRPST